MDPQLFIPEGKMAERKVIIDGLIDAHTRGRRKGYRKGITHGITGMILLIAMIETIARVAT